MFRDAYAIFSLIVNHKYMIQLYNMTLQYDVMRYNTVNRKLQS